MSEEAPKLYTNKPKKAQLKQFQEQQKGKVFASSTPIPRPSSSSAAAASYTMGSSSAVPPPPPPKESFARRYKFLWPLLLTVNLAVGVAFCIKENGYADENFKMDKIKSSARTIVLSMVCNFASQCCLPLFELKLERELLDSNFTNPEKGERESSFIMKTTSQLAEVDPRQVGVCYMNSHPQFGLVTIMIGNLVIIDSNIFHLAYIFMRTKRKDISITEEEGAKDVPSTPASTTAATAAVITEKPVSEFVKLREPIPVDQQRELFKWILEERRKVKPKDPEEKKHIDEEKAILKQFIRAKSIPSI
ncbi:hypothetical protein Pint_28858 [Pistacia integerrima]|uniref:Uncharacterized protein n=1 Tax=Pistacia integerrima TaxID=434235 RepID=A0ACC0WZ60_9ROSI|nr:hypothetical protein Pint_28858 [Pistacia integerrima]